MNTALSAYLHYGYVPQSRNVPPWWPPGTAHIGPEGDVGGATEAECVADGSRRLRRLFQDPGPGEHVVPLSGGIDSRAVLAGLLAAGAGERVTAVTVGTPGTLDFELARRAAARLGARHVALNLETVRVSADRLRIFAQGLARPVDVFESFFYQQLYEHCGPEATYWSGFIVDPLRDNYLDRVRSATWEEARTEFARRGRRAAPVALTESGFDPVAVLPGEALPEMKRATFDEQISIIVRQQDFIEPVILPPGYRTRRPFTDPDWARYMLSMPDRWRCGQRVYRRMLAAAFPDAFALPAKSTRGVALIAPPWRRFVDRQRYCLGALRRRLQGRGCRLNPWLNYIDFDRALHARPDVVETADAVLADLKARNATPWLDLDAIVARQRQGSTPHTKAMLVLISLGIHLQTGLIAAGGR